MNESIENDCLCDNFEIINVVKGSLNDDILNEKDIPAIIDLKNEENKLLILRVTDVSYTKYNYYYLYEVDDDYIISPTSDCWRV